MKFCFIVTIKWSLFLHFVKVFLQTEMQLYYYFLLWIELHVLVAVLRLFVDYSTCILENWEHYVTACSHPLSSSFPSLSSFLPFSFVPFLSPLIRKSDHATWSLPTWIYIEFPLVLSTVKVRSFIFLNHFEYSSIANTRFQTPFSKLQKWPFVSIISSSPRQGCNIFSCRLMQTMFYLCN